MSQFRLDYAQQQIMQISNDAFFYLLQEEEPLDEENFEEACEILSMFPHGFYIEENWKAVEDSDLIECVFVPYVEDDMDFDEYIQHTEYIQQQIKWLDTNHVREWWFNAKTGARTLNGDFKVYTNKYGNKCYHTSDQEKYMPGQGVSMHFLSNFKKRKK